MKSKFLFVLILANVFLWSANATAAPKEQHYVCRNADGHTITVKGYSCPYGYDFVRIVFL